MFSSHDTDTIETDFKVLDAHYGHLSASHLSLETFLQALPPFPQPLSSFQLQLVQSLYGAPQLSLEHYSTSTPQVRAALVLEGLEELTRDKAKEITAGSKSVLDWLYHILDHLNETSQEFLASIGSLEHQLKDFEKFPAAKGFFVYKSIPRNLATHGEVKPESIPKGLDQFLIKAKTVRDSCGRGEFSTLLEHMTQFTSNRSEEENTKAIDEVFSDLKNYLKTILPNITAGPLEHLAVIEGRVLMYDPVDYISDHRFYSYAPTEAKGAVSTVFSGIIRVDQDVDLKQEIAYLSPQQCHAILNVVKKHLHDFDDHDRFKKATVHLRETQTELFNKYNKAKRMRKDRVDAKPYVLLMNICAGLVYGMHVKALNKSVSIITAALRYVAKSVKALEMEHKSNSQTS